MNLFRIDWNIADAKEALQCAVLLGDWDGVIKYANQLKELERQRFDLVSRQVLSNTPIQVNA